MDFKMRASRKPRIFMSRCGFCWFLCLYSFLRLNFKHLALSDSWLSVVFFAVRYSSNPLSKKCHFGHVGGADRNLTFVLQRTAPVTTGKSKERKERISKASMVTLRDVRTCFWWYICEAISMELFCTSLFKSSTWSRLPKKSCYGCVL